MPKIVEIGLPGYVPKPKARPRLGKHKVYSPSRKGEDALAWLIMAAVRERYSDFFSFTEPVKLEIDIQSPSRPRGDIDNHAKFILDALEKSGLICNDSQVTRLEIEFVPGGTRLDISVMPADMEE